MVKLKDDFEASGGVWKEWRMGDLFDFSAIKQAKSQAMIPENPQGIPYVIQSTKNNMYKTHVDEQWLIDNDECPVNGNAIVLGVTLPAVSYQPYKFGASQVITARAEFLNESVGSYLVSVLKKYIEMFSYNAKPGMQIYKDMQVVLPTLNNSLALDYMEQYISMLEEEKMLQVDKFLKDSGLNDTTLTEEEAAALEKFRNGEVRFEERKIGDLFSCKTGDVDVQRCHLNGKGTIYINSGVTDLGIIGKTDMKARVFPANTITIDMFGNAYYRDFEYKMATHAHVFSLSHLDDKLNKENGLYICASLGYFTQLFSFNDMCNWSKMKDKEIWLPQTIGGDIDYTFMQHFISALEKLVIKGVVKYKDEVLNADGKALYFAVAAEPISSYGQKLES